MVHQNILSFKESKYYLYIENTFITSIYYIRLYQFLFRFQEPPIERAPTEVVRKIFSYLTIQEILAGPGVACHRFYNIVKSCKELWRKLKTTVEFSVLSLSVL